MNIYLFIIVSSLYIVSLALIDGLFNRLIFRDIKKLPYESKEKAVIYQLPEWRYIGVFFLVVLPVLIPLIVSYFLGGLQYVLVYLAVLLFWQWDVIFGKLVFEDWFGDSPSIALPFVGWLKFNIFVVIGVRLVLFGIVVLMVL